MPLHYKMTFTLTLSIGHRKMYSQLDWGRVFISGVQQQARFYFLFMRNVSKHAVKCSKICRFYCVHR